MDIANRNSTLPESSTRVKKKRKEEKQSILHAHKSEKTMKDYLFYLNNFLTHVYDGDKIHPDELLPLMKEIEIDDVDDYVAHLLKERGLKKTSINKIMSSLKSLYNELEKSGHENPTKHLELFKTTRDLENVLKLSYSDIKEILKNYKVRNENSYRNVTILQTLFYTGMRSQELIDIKYKHFLKRDNEYFLKLEMTKSGKEQYKAVHEYLVEKLINYKNFVKEYHNFSDEDMEEMHIFPSKLDTGKKLTYKALYSIIQEMGKVIEKDISPHNVRHAIATELSLNGADILEVRDFLGHSDSRVTEVYINAKSILEKRVLQKIPVPNLE